MPARMDHDVLFARRFLRQCKVGAEVLRDVRTRRIDVNERHARAWKFRAKARHEKAYDPAADHGNVIPR